MSILKVYETLGLAPFAIYGHYYIENDLILSKFPVSLKIVHNKVEIEISDYIHQMFAS